MKVSIFKILAVAVAFVGAVGTAQAVPVLDTSGAIAGSGIDSNTFAIGSAGVYEVTLTDVGFPDAFSFLAVGMFKGSAFLGGIFAPGSFTFTAPTAGSYKATVFGTTSAPRYFGSYGLTVTAVPEAQTWAMMLVGVGLVGFQLRRGGRHSRKLV
jgi:hypothetical protein